MIEWFARNSVAANLLMFSIILLGIYAITTMLRVEVFPQFEARTIEVRVVLRGATPEDAELGIASRIESAVRDIEGIKRYYSRSNEGFTSVRIEVDEDYDPETVLDRVKAEVDSISTLPAEAERPLIRLMEFRIDVITVILAGPFDEDEIRVQAERVRDDIRRTADVGFVELARARNYEISIEATQDALREFGLSLRDLATAVRGSSLDISAGNVRTQGGDVLIRSQGQAYRRSDFEEIVVKTNADGSIVRLGDIATVRDAFNEDAVSTFYNGMPAAMVDIKRSPSQSVLETSQIVKEYVASHQDSLPRGMTMTYWDDNSQILRERLGVLASGAVQGSILVLVLLSLFLRPTVAFWVFISIPISFLGATAVMGYFDLSLNIMSAFGFIMVLGIVVDDAIVTGESVYRHLRTSEDGLTAAIEGTKDVAVPVTFGVLTTMAAFAPMLFVGGGFGSFTTPLAGVVIAALAFSLIESKLVLPAHLKHLRGDSPYRTATGLRGWQQRFANRFEHAVLRYFKPALQKCVEYRYTTISVFLGLLMVMVASLLSGWMPFHMMISPTMDQIGINLRMPIGTPFDVTDRHTQRILAASLDLKERYLDEDTGMSSVRHVVSSTGAGSGGRGSHLANIALELERAKTRNPQHTVDGMVRELRQAIGTIPGAEALNFRSSLVRFGDVIDIELKGTDFGELGEVADAITERLSYYPTVSDISQSLSEGKEELRVEVSDQGHVLGLTRNDIVGQIGEAFKGYQVQRIQRGQEDIRVIVRFPIDERRSYETLSEMLIRTPQGARVPLAHVATLAPGIAPTEIYRVNGERTISVTADVDRERENLTVLMADLEDHVRALVAQYPSVHYSFEGEAREQRESLESFAFGIVLVLFLVYCLLALPLKSYVQPLVVIVIIPFGMVGAIVGHWIMGQSSLSMLSVFGLMALMGVMVNDSLVLVDYVNKRVRAGESLVQSVLDAGVVRFRPVLLTSLTTFFGLLPLMLDRSTTSQFLIPMAISLGYGILFATVVTLILVPVNLLILQDIKAGLKRYGRLVKVAFGSSAS